MKNFCLIFLLILLFTSISAKSRFDEATIKGELRKPGVKLVAIDFYMTGCEPCDAAIPEWKKLKDEYGDSMKLIVVAPQRDDGSCSVKGWHPDKIVCDEDMEIAEQWGVKDFPQAFLYSWHNSDPLVKLGHVRDVRKAIKKYFKTIPRVALDADEESENLLPMVEEALITNSKIEVVADEDEREELMEIRKESHKLRYDEDSKCELGKEIAANSILKITKQDETLSLKLSSAEKSCTMAAATKILSGNRGKLKTEIASAVYDLLSQMFGDISVPGEGRQQARAQKSSGEISNFQDALACEQARKESSNFVWKAYLKSYPTGECAAEAKAELDKTACNTAEKRNSIDGWKEYLEEFPDGNCAAKAKDEFDKTACKIAEKKSSIDGWKKYLEEFPNGKCKARAKAEFDKASCKAAKQKNSIEGWEEYLKEYPDGECADKANNFIENHQTKEKEACKKAKNKSSERGWEEYLEKFPEGQCVAEANEALDNIACTEAEDDNSLKGWKEYLDKYPNGKCSAKARENFSNRENIEEMMKKGRDMKIAGAVLFTIGTVGFVTGMSVGASYDNPCNNGDNTSCGKEFFSHIIGGTVGGAMLAIGLPVMIAGVIKEKKAKLYLEMNNLAVLPKKDGFYAAVGFNF